MKSPRSLCGFAMAGLLCACAGDPWDDSVLRPKYSQFEQADVDHSGKLSRAEAEALPYIAGVFARADVDANGLVSWDEIQNVARTGRRR